MSERLEGRKKSAVVLLNLGGPDRPEEVKNFLFNLFYDPYIMRIPNPLRWFFAKLISNLRENKARKIYGYIGGGSPIYDETKKQALVLEKNLEKEKAGNQEFKIFICMRHFSPRASEIIDEMKYYDPDEIILLPLYPQFSTTTTGSSVKECIEIFKSSFVSKDVKTICCYPVNGKFLDSHLELLKKAIDEIELENSTNYRLLFSAHSLPVKIIKAGDPYQWQIEYTVKNIISRLGINKLDYKLSYQSKVGPIEWLKPSTEDEIIKACQENKSLIIVPIAFVSEHVETLVELDIEYKAIADKYNIKYIRVPTLRTNNIFIESLSEMIIQLSNQNPAIITNDSGKRICPAQFTYCPCNVKIQ